MNKCQACYATVKVVKLVNTERLKNVYVCDDCLKREEESFQAVKESSRTAL